MVQRSPAVEAAFATLLGAEEVEVLPPALGTAQPGFYTCCRAHKTELMS